MFRMDQWRNGQSEFEDDFFNIYFVAWSNYSNMIFVIIFVGKKASRNFEPCRIILVSKCLLTTDDPQMASYNCLQVPCIMPWMLILTYLIWSLKIIQNTG